MDTINSTTSSSSSSRRTPGNKTTFPNPISRRRRHLFFLISFVIIPISLSLLLLLYPSHDPASTPPPRLLDRRALRSAHEVASGRLAGPEDLAYDPVEGWVYTGTDDGWIKRVKIIDPKVNSSSLSSANGEVGVVVEEVVNTGGRPLGVAFGRRRRPRGGNGGIEMFIADAVKGLLKLTEDRELILLTKEAEGKEFKLTDGVDVSGDDEDDGTVYFTDASFKYGYTQSVLDNLEGEPHGRLLSFNPSTGETRVLLRDLYFPNGVALSPDQKSLVFCETALRRCSRYHITGSRAGKVDLFVHDLPGSPDNIHYDPQGELYWIAIFTSLPKPMYKVMEFSLVRKALMMAENYVGLKSIQKNAGVMAVDLHGKVVAYFSDTRLAAITSAIRVGEYLYCGSLYSDHILRLNLTHYPAL